MVWQEYVEFFKKPLNCLSKYQYHFAFSPAMYENSCCSTSLPAFGVVNVPDFGHSNRCVVVSYYCFNLHFPQHMMWSRFSFFPFLKSLFHYGLSQDIEYSSLCYIVGPCCLSILFFYKFIYLFILFLAALGLRCCTWAFSSAASRGYSSLRCVGFSLQWLLLLQSTGSRHSGFRICDTWAQQLWLMGSGAQAQQLWCPDLVVPWHVGSSWTRDGTHVPCIGRRILNHYATKEVPAYLFYIQQFVSANPKLLIYPPPPLSPFGKHKFVFCVGESVFVLYISSFVSHFRFHILMISYDICHSLSDLLHLV